MGYCRVVGNTTTVNTYIDIYCSLVSRIVVLSTATENRNLKCFCYWFHPSGVDQTIVGGMNACGELYDWLLCLKTAHGASRQSGAGSGSGKLCR